MSSSSKAVIWVVAIVVVAGAIWWYVAAQNPAEPETYGTNATSSVAMSQGTSDQSLNQDLTQIDAQMNGLSSDSASVNQSFSDQPIQ